MHVLGDATPDDDRFGPDVMGSAEAAAHGQHLRIRLRGSSYDSTDDRAQQERFVAGNAVAGAW